MRRVRRVSDEERARGEAKVSKAARGHVCRGLARTQRKVIVLDKQQLLQTIRMFFDRR